LAAITPTRIVTSDVSIQRFAPDRRGCYLDEEFHFQNLQWSSGFRYSIKNCLYEAVIGKILEHCGCLPNYAMGRTASNYIFLKVLSHFYKNFHSLKECQKICLTAFGLGQRKYIKLLLNQHSAGFV
jgi:hypothetical protein